MSLFLLNAALFTSLIPLIEIEIIKPLSGLTTKNKSKYYSNYMFLVLHFGPTSLF